MRAVENFTYIIEKTFKPLPIFTFLQEKSGMSDREMYGTFNMGAGFAVYVAPRDVKAVLDIAKKNKIKAMDAGYVKKAKGGKKISILPLDIEFDGSSLAVR